MKEVKRTNPKKEDKSIRAQKCAQEIDSILKKYNCGIKAVVIFQEIGPIVYDKQVYPLD